MTMTSSDQLQLPEAPEWLKKFCESNHVILGSSSQWRRKVMEKTGCRVADTMDPNIDEKAIRDPDPERLVIAISNAKADALWTRIKENDTPERTEGYLVCTDQVALCDDVIREKPVDEQQAREFIYSYSVERKPVRTCSGIVVVDLSNGNRAEGIYYNEVLFKVIPDDVIDQIVKDKVVYTCCGGFSVDDPLMGAWVEYAKGGMDGIMGLPLQMLQSLCMELVGE